MKKLVYFCSNFVHGARAKLPTIMPNLETHDIISQIEVCSKLVICTDYICHI
jgi:hypothetical protein